VFEDAYANLTLGRAPITFPAFVEEERRLMEVIIGER